MASYAYGKLKEKFALYLQVHGVHPDGVMLKDFAKALKTSPLQLMEYVNMKADDIEGEQTKEGFRIKSFK